MRKEDHRYRELEYREYECVINPPVGEGGPLGGADYSRGISVTRRVPHLLLMPCVHMQARL